MSKNGNTEVTGSVPFHGEESNRVGSMAIVGILGAIAYILMWIEFPIPIMPSFIKFDFSDFPALLAAFAMGPIAGITVELIKNVFWGQALLLWQVFSIREIKQEKMRFLLPFSVLL